MRQEDLFDNGSTLTIDDMLAMQDGIKEARKDTTPVPIVTKDTLIVAGDPNKTEVKQYDYTIRFRFPNAMAEKMNIKEEAIVKRLTSSVYVDIEYPDVRVLPRYDLEIMAAFVRILPYFVKNVQGKFNEDKTKAELLEETKKLCKEIGDDLYDVVTVVVGVDRDLEMFMDFDSVVGTFTKILHDFPEILNEAEGFTE